MAVQWVHLGDEVLFASERGARIGQRDIGSISFLTSMPDSSPSHVETTRYLLDGAIAAAERGGPGPPQPPMTALRWAWHLAAQWYSARHSIALIPIAIERFLDEGRREVAQFARQKLADESGHDQLPLTDLRALGFDGETLVKTVPPDRSVVAGIEYARSTLDGTRPVEFLGYMYALERRMMRIPESWLLELERTLGRDANATAGVRLHANQLDVDHVAQAISFFATLASDDRASIATGAHRITQIRCSGLRGPQPSEEELDAWLSPFRLGRARSADTGKPGN